MMSSQKEQRDKLPRFGKEDKSKLKRLFDLGPARGGISDRDSTKDYINQVLEEHFPHRNKGENAYEKFAKTFRNHCNDRKIDRGEAGYRKRKIFVFFCYYFFALFYY